MVFENRIMLLISDKSIHQALFPGSKKKFLSFLVLVTNGSFPQMRVENGQWPRPRYNSHRPRRERERALGPYSQQPPDMARTARRRRRQAATDLVGRPSIQPPPPPFNSTAVRASLTHSRSHRFALLTGAFC